MTPEDLARTDLLGHYDTLIGRARLVADGLRRELDLTDNQAELQVVQDRLSDVEDMVAGNEAKAALVRSKLD
jgi:hypothetical protein